MTTNDQKGFVSIIVAATIMIILALITIGFTTYVQREQRQSLDRQLSRQALYAAESGINETFKILLQNPSLVNEKTDCDPTTFGLVTLNKDLDIDNGVAYTCVQYDKDPTELTYSVKDTKSKIVQLATSSGSNFDDIEVSWGNQDPNNNIVGNLPSCSSAGEFPSERTDTIPVLKFDLTNMSNLNRNDLLANSDYIYLSPCSGGAGGVTEYTYSDSTKGNVVKVDCTNTNVTYPCRVVIDLQVESSPKYLARFRPVYASANVAIRGNEITFFPITKEAEFLGQFSIDVTAKAGDVIRRLRAAIPLLSLDEKPEAVFQSFTDVCKLLDVNLQSKSVINTCP